MGMPNDIGYLTQAAVGTALFARTPDCQVMPQICQPALATGRVFVDLSSPATMMRLPRLGRRSWMDRDGPACSRRVLRPSRCHPYPTTTTFREPCALDARRSRMPLERQGLPRVAVDGINSRETLYEVNLTATPSSAWRVAFYHPAYLERPRATSRCVTSMFTAPLCTSGPPRGTSADGSVGSISGSATQTRWWRGNRRRKGAVRRGGQRPAR